MKIYLARPISHLSYEEVMGYFKRMTKILRKMGYAVLQPMVSKEILKGTKHIAPIVSNPNPVCTNHAIIERDRWMVQTADIVYCNLFGAERISIGCCMELAWSHDRGKHTIVVMEANNIHRHAFIVECADVIFETENEALSYFRMLRG